MFRSRSALAVPLDGPWLVHGTQVPAKRNRLLAGLCGGQGCIGLLLARRHLPLDVAAVGGGCVPSLSGRMGALGDRGFGLALLSTRRSWQTPRCCMGGERASCVRSPFQGSGLALQLCCRSAASVRRGARIGRAGSGPISPALWLLAMALFDVRCILSFAAARASAMACGLAARGRRP